MEILIDNGHGVETPGKRSPDGRFREYHYNRLIARAIVEHLQLRGYDASLVVPEEEDISLEERCRRINRVAIRHGHEPQRHLRRQHPRQCSRQRQNVAQRHWLVRLHFPRAHRVRQAGHLSVQSRTEASPRPPAPYRLQRR